MLTALSSAIQRFNNKFTYRQRFVFFSLIFIITTPLPGYWMLKTQNFFINRAEWQSVGNRYQDLVGSLHYDLLRHHLAAYTSEETSLSLFDLNEIIEEKFKQLKRLNDDTTFVVQPQLGEGFSSVPSDTLELAKAHELWREAAEIALAIPDTVSKDFYPAIYADLTQQLQKMLLIIRNTFQLEVTPTVAEQHLLESSLTLLPQSQSMISELFIMSPPTSLEQKISLLVLADQLKENLHRLKQTLHPTYAHFPLSSKKDALSSSRRAFADFYSGAERFLHELYNENPLSLSEALKTIEAAEATRDFNVTLANGLTQSRLSAVTFERNISLAIYTFVALLLTFYIIFRVLTRHLKEIYFHLCDLTKGKFGTCFCSHFKDEFGLMGRTFDRMGQSIQSVLKELNKLGQQLSDSVGQIVKTTKEQEDNVSRQEAQVEEIQKVAQTIAEQSRSLANTMDNLSHTAIENSVADTAKESLDKMQEKMLGLSTASSDIITSLNSLHEKVDSANLLIDFMGKVSNQAGLISLNSAIETANMEKQKVNFAKITDEIQRFSEKTSDSTLDIEKIIVDILISVDAVKAEANGCLNEIDQGVHRLINVSHQLGSITTKGKQQIVKFQEVNDVMQMQAIAAENIITSISSLSETAVENSASIRVLHQSIEDLGETTEELQKTLGVFV